MLFDTRYFWAVFTAKDPSYLRKLRTLFETSKARFASSVSLYEVYKLTLAHEDKAVAGIHVNTIKKQFEIVDVNSEIAEEGAMISPRKPKNSYPDPQDPQSSRQPEPCNQTGPLTGTIR